MPATGSVFQYPPARTVQVVDDYHGTRVADPYRWLEDMESPEVRRWASAQTALAERQLKDDLRGRLVTRMRKLGEPWDQIAQNSPTRVAGLEFQLATSPDGDRRLLTVHSVGAGGEPRVLVDPKRFGGAKSITRFQVSPDALHVAYALAEGGSEWVETRILRVTDGQDLPETVDGLLWAPPLWTMDGRGFFYVHQERPRTGEHFALRAPSVRYHVAGSPQPSAPSRRCPPRGRTSCSSGSR
jgi:prolyl oligopeptidase